MTLFITCSSNGTSYSLTDRFRAKNGSLTVHEAVPVFVGSWWCPHALQLTFHSSVRHCESYLEPDLSHISVFRRLLSYPHLIFLQSVVISADHLCLDARSFRNSPASYLSTVGDTISEDDRSIQQCQAASMAPFSFYASRADCGWRSSLFTPREQYYFRHPPRNTHHPNIEEIRGIVASLTCSQRLVSKMTVEVVRAFRSGLRSFLTLSDL